jgi:hypothetical protein
MKPRRDPVMSLKEHAHSPALPVNKRRDQALKVQLKAQLRGSSPRWTSGKILVQVLVSGVLVALFVAVAIAAFHRIKSISIRSRNSGDRQILSEPSPIPLSATEPGPMPPNANPVYCGTVGTVVAENPTQPIHPAQVPSPTATPQPGRHCK